jgi:hypothetical protein
MQFLASHHIPRATRGNRKIAGGNFKFLARQRESIKHAAAIRQSQL